MIIQPRATESPAVEAQRPSEATAPEASLIDADRRPAVAEGDRSAVLQGLARMQAMALPDAGAILIGTADTPVATKALVDEAVTLSYLEACRGTPGSDRAYLDTCVRAAKFYADHLPDDPRRGALERLVVDVAVWMNWDSPGSSDEEKAGVRAAAEYTRSNPKPDTVATMADARLQEYFHPPAPAESLSGLPDWLRDMLPMNFLSRFSFSYLGGTMHLYRVNHLARAESLLSKL